MRCPEGIQIQGLPWTEWGKRRNKRKKKKRTGSERRRGKKRG
jgi:hypothetical protein